MNLLAVLVNAWLNYQKRDLIRLKAAAERQLRTGRRQRSRKVHGNFTSRRPWRRSLGYGEWRGRVRAGDSCSTRHGSPGGWAAAAVAAGAAVRWVGPAVGERARSAAPESTAHARPDGLEGPARRRSYWRYVRRLVQGTPAPPYPRVCQVGDLALRAVAALVEPAQLAGPELQRLVERLARDAAPALRGLERAATRSAAAGTGAGVPRGALPRL